MYKYLLSIITFLALTVSPQYAVSQDNAPIQQYSYGQATTGRYAENSVLNTGSWVKIQIQESGLYKLTYEQLQEMGIANPANVRIYGYGGAMLPELFTSTYIDDLPLVSIHMEKGQDGVFSAGDFIIFYAQGIVKWTYDTSLKYTKHTINTYSNYGYYFVTSDLGASPTISYKTTLTSTTTDTITTYNGLYLHEIERINLINSGKTFFNEEFNSKTPTHSFQVSIPDIVPNQQAILQVHAAHKNSETCTVDMKINNSSIGTMSINGISNNLVACDQFKAQPFTLNSGNINVSLTFSLTKKEGYLDYFALETERYLTKTASEYITFRQTKYLSEVGNYTYLISNTDANTVVWDVTSLTNIQAVTTKYQNGSTTFVDRVSSQREYVAFNPSTDVFLTPTVVGPVANQNLHASSQIDMAIISNTDFLSEANRLAQAHAETDGLNVIVVDAEAVYNEFSSGTPDATAYRRFMKMFYDRATSADLAPKYLLLFGDGSFDNRRILSSTIDPDTYRLLTYQTDNSYSEVSSITTDDYFAFLDDNEVKWIQVAIMDIAVGRFPCSTAAHAKAVVDKTIKYMQNDDPGAWKNQGIYLADDGDNNDHITGADTVCNLTQHLYPSFLTRKLFFDSYIQETTASGSKYPILNKEFYDYINNGVLTINYMGHGGYNGIADERPFSIGDVDNMYNTRLPFWFTATCNFGRFDDRAKSIGEKLMTHADGGAIALATTTRTVIARQNNLINLEFAKTMLAPDTDGKINTLGRALMKAKNERAKASDINRLSYALIGDPAIRLNYPSTHKVTIDTINGRDITADIDTIRALGTVIMKGFVSDLQSTDDAVDASFNGMVEIKVFDKLQSFTTLCNDVGAKPFTYTYRSTPIFDGKVAVTNGRFEIQFIVPKDIRYNFGTGKIIMYAYDPTQGFDGNGTCSNIAVGGEADNIIWENEGPEIKLYLNSETFTDGSKVNENPLFVAHVSDQSGINTIGTGFGHDILLKLDNDPRQEYILNSYYQSSVGSFSDGYIYYQLKDLTPGKHSLYFRVWDMQNNSSSAELQFEVVKGLAPTVNNLYVIPNPVQDVADIIIENDRPNQPSEVYAYIYNIAGQLVWTNNGNFVASSDSRITMQWNVDDSSMNLTNGLYLLKVATIDTNGNKEQKSTKILLQRQ